MKNMVFENVSRETFDKFLTYYDLISDWNRRTSLVQIDTMEDFWQRHILDSLQLAQFLPSKSVSILDMGTGAGFPGMVLAMDGYTNVTLCDSNFRKTIFLSELSRITETSVEILNKRVEDIGDKKYDVLVSRACSSLSSLIEVSKKIVSRETMGFCLFLKGKTLESEIEKARQSWFFDHEIYKSETSDDGRVIKIWNIEKH